MSRAPLQISLRLFAIVCATLMLAAPARAAFHQWLLTEIYTNSTGTLQFIEFFTSQPTEQFVGGQQIFVDDIPFTTQHTFTIPTNLPGGTANKRFLIGTAGIQANGGPAPDYIMPNNFLFLNGGDISFFGPNGGTYTALPTNGTLSRTWNGGDALNTPTNFAGTVGFVNPVPEPTTMVLMPLAAGIIGFKRWRARRAAKSESV